MILLIQRIKELHGLTSTVAWVCLVCATLLIAPMSLLQNTATDNTTLLYTPYIWFLALLSGSYLITLVISFVFSHFKEQAQQRCLVGRRNKMIRQLDFEEKAVLREFIIQRKNVLALPMTEPAVSNLLASGVLVGAFETQEIKGVSRIIKLAIAIDARELLTMKILGLPVGKLTEEEATVLKAARPDYARSNYITL